MWLHIIWHTTSWSTENKLDPVRKNMRVTFKLIWITGYSCLRMNPTDTLQYYRLRDPWLNGMKCINSSTALKSNFGLHYWHISISVVLNFHSTTFLGREVCSFLLKFFHVDTYKDKELPVQSHTAKYNSLQMLIFFFDYSSPGRKWMRKREALLRSKTDLNTQSP